MPITRRFLVFPYSASSSTKRVFTEISNYVRGPKVQWRGRSFAASVPSDKPVRKGQRRPCEERKVMVESFVNRYRAMNLGNFPTASMARKEVGGSYYTIRKIIQELKYKDKMPSIERMDKISQGKELSKENGPSTEGEDSASSQITTESSTEGEDSASSRITTESSAEFEEVSTSEVTTYEQLHSTVVSCAPDAGNHFHAKAELETSTLDETANSEKFVEPIEIGDDTGQVATGGSMLKNKPSEDVLKFDGPLDKPEQKDQPDLEKYTRDVLGSQKDEELLKKSGTKDAELLKNTESKKDEEGQKKPSMWGNLKSLANEFLNFLRKP